MLAGNRIETATLGDITAAVTINPSTLWSSLVFVDQYQYDEYSEFRKNKVDVTDVITNGPATIVMFSDGTKVVSKAHMGDKPSAAFGLVWCCLRKAMRNRTCDHMEKVVRKVIRKCTAGDMRALGKALIMAADWLEG